MAKDKENFEKFIKEEIKNSSVYSRTDASIFYQKRIIEEKKALEGGELSPVDEFKCKKRIEAYQKANKELHSKAPAVGTESSSDYWSKEYKVSSNKGAKITAGVIGVLAAAGLTAGVLGQSSNPAEKPTIEDPINPSIQVDVENEYADNIGKPVHYEHTKDGIKEVLDGHEFVASENEIKEVKDAKNGETPADKFIENAVNDGISAGSTEDQAVIDVAEAINAPGGVALNVEANDELPVGQAIEEIDTLGKNLDEGVYALSGKWSFKDRNAGNYVASFFAENGKEALKMAQAQGLDVSNYELFAAIVKPENLIPYLDATANYHSNPNAKVSYTENGVETQIVAGANFVSGWVSATDATRVADLAWIDKYSKNGETVLTGEMLGERLEAYEDYKNALSTMNVNDGAGLER